MVVANELKETARVTAPVVANQSWVIFGFPRA